MRRNRFYSLVAIGIVVVSTSIEPLRGEQKVGRPSYKYHGDAGRCSGFACAGGEVDVRATVDELRIIWGAPISRYISAPLPSAGSTANSVTFSPNRVGLTKYVGAWFAEMGVRSPYGGGGKAFQFAFWQQLDPKDLRIVESHAPEACLCRSRVEATAGGLSYQLDLLAYRDMSGVIFARELVLDRDRIKQSLPLVVRALIH